MKRQLTLASLVYWVPIIIIVALVNEVTEHEPLFFDVPILEFMKRISTPILDTTVLFLTNLGGIVFVSLATALVAYIAYRKLGKRAASMVVLIAGGTALMNVVLKLLFQRSRPELWQTLVHESSYSFPSGHAMASSALAFSIVAIFWSTKWRIWTLVTGTIYVITIGLSRMYLGVHYPSDVLAGWAISFLWGVSVYRLVLSKKSPEQKATTD